MVKQLCELENVVCVRLARVQSQRVAAAVTRGTDSPAVAALAVGATREPTGVP